MKTAQRVGLFGLLVIVVAALIAVVLPQFCIDMGGWEDRTGTLPLRLGWSDLLGRRCLDVGGRDGQCDTREG